MAESNVFNWSDQEIVVVKRVDAIAVYRNPEGDIVIRQERPLGDGDAIITVPSQYAYTMVEAIQQQLRGPGPGMFPPPRQVPPV